MGKKKWVALFLLMAMTLGLAGCTTQEAMQSTEVVTPSQPGTQPSTSSMPEKEEIAFTPGTYRIETMGHNEEVIIDVTFSENAITDITVVEHSESQAIGDVSMEDMAKKIIAQQSLNIDALSGATISGAVMRGAVTQAVKEAGGDPAAMQSKEKVDTTSLADVTADVVVVGAGAAGLCATVMADELGMKVILLEQLGLIGGSSARAGFLLAGGTKVQAEQGIELTAEAVVTMLNRPSSAVDSGLYNEEGATRIWNAASGTIDWLYDLGIEFGPVNSSMQHYGKNGERLGSYLACGMQEVMDKRGIDYRLNTTAVELITEAGEVTGVVVQAPNGTTYNIHAKAVILATGGYLGNQDMVAKYNPDFVGYPTDVSIGADGSGMRMAEAVGGVLAYMDQCNYHGLAGTYNGASRSLTLPAGNGCIAVNSDAQRFVAESGAYETLTRAVMAQEGDVFAILDQAVMDLDVIKGDHGLSNIVAMYEVADTVEELAEKLGLAPDALRETVNTYSSYVQNGEDLAFEKSASSMRSDFTTAPYYGVKVHVETHTSHGGIVVDADKRALNADSAPIPGLYAAGETSATHISGSGTLTDCVVSGRIAAQTVFADRIQSE